MKDTVYVVGHRNPDTDSICSAIAYANLKNQLNVNAIACRLGPLNDETKFVLKRFEVDNPLLTDDARSRIKDINFDQPNILSKEATIKEAWKLLVTNSCHSICVLDENDELCGFITSSNLSSLRTKKYIEIEAMMKSATLDNIASTVKGEIVLNTTNFNHTGAVIILTLNESNRYSNKIKGGICILSDDKEKQLNMIKLGAKCLIISCGSKVTDEVILEATAAGCGIVTTDKDSMAIAQVIYESFPISNIMSKNIVSFSDEEFVEDVSKKMINTRYRSYPIVDANNKLVGTISRFHLLKHAKKHYILVDHSAKNQSISNIEKAYIEEIIDHHHIGNIETDHPIYYRNQKCGCTSTIIAQMYQENNIVPSKKMAALMLSAIISDTLNFKSATTTKLDIKVAKDLADIAKINLESYAIEMLSASVSLIDSTPKQILNRDLKSYEINGKKVAIGQSNYYSLEDLQTILPEFKQNLKNELEIKNLDLLIMMFTHVSGDGSMLVYEGILSYVIDEIIEKKIDDNSGYDHSLISRKQQLIPKLSESLNTL